MAIGAKTMETRGQRTSHRGDIAIHAAVADHGIPESIVPATMKAFQDRGIVPTPASMGCILAVVELYDCMASENFSIYGNRGFKITEEEFIFGNYSPGRFVYLTRNLRRLKQPVHCRGAQPIGWTVPPEIEQQVRQQLYQPHCARCGEKLKGITMWTATLCGLCADDELNVK